MLADARHLLAIATPVDNGVRHSTLVPYTGGMDNLRTMASALEERARNIEIASTDPVAQMGFTQVPNFLFKGSGLSMGAIVVYAKFLSYAWHNNCVFPGQLKLADELDVGERSVRTWINELKDAGLIEVTQRGLGKTNIYRLHFTVAKKHKRK